MSGSPFTDHFTDHRPHHRPDTAVHRPAAYRRPVSSGLCRASLTGVCCWPRHLGMPPERREEGPASRQESSESGAVLDKCEEHLISGLNRGNGFSNRLVSYGSLASLSVMKQPSPSTRVMAIRLRNDRSDDPSRLTDCGRAAVPVVRSPSRVTPFECPANARYSLSVSFLAHTPSLLS